MKRLFSISKSKGKPSKQLTTNNKQPSLLDATTHNAKPSLPTKYLATAIPHPHPFDRILILASADGLLLRPDIPYFETLVRVSWGKDGKVEAIDSKTVTGIPEWSEAAPVFGIVGLIRLFTG
jgi:phosphatidylinositol 4-phosphatase